MPAVQKQFEDFHSAICFDEDDEKATLREKRDIIIKALKDNLGDDVPSFTNFNQGSYSMHTGVVPLDGNFDIDVGLVFDCDQNKFPDPVVLKKKVRDAVGALAEASFAGLRDRFRFARDSLRLLAKRPTVPTSILEARDVARL